MSRIHVPIDTLDESAAERAASALLVLKEFLGVAKAEYPGVAAEGLFDLDKVKQYVGVVSKASTGVNIRQVMDEMTPSLEGVNDQRLGFIMFGDDIQFE